MKKLLLVAAVLTLVLPGPAQAGCWATVGLAPLPPPGLQAGEAWTPVVRVLQHGRTPMRDAKPEVRVRTTDGKLLAFKAKLMARAGSYRARVVFPAAGRYSLAVYDGFPYSACAREHTFRSVTIEEDSSDSWISTLPLGGGLLGLALLAGMLFLRRPRRAPEPVPGL